jgi:hypothetical protein
MSGFVSGATDVVGESSLQHKITCPLFADCCTLQSSLRDHVYSSVSATVVAVLTPAGSSVATDNLCEPPSKASFHLQGTEETSSQPPG